MDKFDESIKRGAAQYKPSKHFTDEVMNRVYANSVKKHRSFGWQKFSVSLAGLTAVLALVFVGSNAVLPTPQAPSRGSQYAQDEFSSELNSIAQDFAADNTANGISTSDLNDISP